MKEIFTSKDKGDRFFFNWRIGCVMYERKREIIRVEIKLDYINID